MKVRQRGINKTGSIGDIATAIGRKRNRIAVEKS